ncbi:MAG: Fe-S protein assembly chaperone HscA [Janthinobacterium lividum]
MQLFEIEEPHTNRAAPRSSNNIAVGIDFGTTNSSIAISKNRKVRTIIDNKGQDLVPSIIQWNNQEQANISRSLQDGSFLLSSIKRFLGKSSNEILNNQMLFNKVKSFVDLDNEIPKLRINNETISFPEAAAEIFKYLKSQAENDLQHEVNKVVITVPAYFDDAARGAVMLAARIAGFEILRILAEPTAAAYSYGLEKNALGNYLVYDLGGGTFDVSILYMKEGIFQVVATGGNSMLGGDDIDNIIARYFQELYNLNDHQALYIAKHAKEELSSLKTFSKLLDTGQHVELSRKHFEDLVLPLIEQTISIVSDTLEQASFPPLDGIIMVGGCTKIPLIAKLLRKNFNNIIYNDIDPDRAVAWGAALQAENLTSENPDTLLIDVVPLSLGLELYGGLLEKIILRNSPLPLTVTKEFTTYANNQTAMKFHIFQGEREMVHDCRSLAKFELENIPPMQAGAARIEVTFSIDIDGILSVSALEKVSGKSQTIIMNPSYGLDEVEIEEILTNAYKNASKDHKERILVEKTLQAKSLIYNLKNSVDLMPNIVSQDSKNKIHKAIVSLEKSLISEDVDLIEAKIEKLEVLAKDFNNTELNEIVGQLLKGKNINKV